MLTIIGRLFKPGGSECEPFILSSRSNVNFNLVPSISNITSFLGDRRKAELCIEAALADSDALIARIPSELGFLAARVAERMGKPWAVEVVGCTWDGLWNYGTMRAKLWAPHSYHVMRRTVAKAKYVLYVSEAFLQQRYPSHNALTVSCSNVELALASEAVLRARMQRIRNVQRSTVVFGLIGSMVTRYKGIQTVLAALPSVRRVIPRLEFRLLGEGSEEPWRREAERRGVEDIVRFDGTVPPGSAVMEWLDDIDIYVQPSLQEGLPRALVEAMSRGCPALGSRRAGIPELLANECLISPGSHRELADKMIKAASDNAWREEQAQRNWATSKRYAHSLLSERRAAFWRRFAADAMVRNLRQKQPPSLPPRLNAARTPRTGS